ncbi:hypothetical protein B0H14DRAFT_3478071 [Mycena olivaceomarginata]|nr:hypothetical protein B0H14DRAFT_3478071 [Mycena olivaceomarginata]
MIGGSKIIPGVFLVVFAYHLVDCQFCVSWISRTADASVTCSVEPGSYTILQTVALPKEVPKRNQFSLFYIRAAPEGEISIVVNIESYTRDEDDMVCVELTVQFCTFFQLWELTA